MNLLRRFEGKPFRNLAYLIGSQTVNVVVEIEDSGDIYFLMFYYKRTYYDFFNEKSCDVIKYATFN